jgi:hypothetical protein
MNALQHKQHMKTDNSLTVTTEAEGIVSLPGRVLWCVVVAIAFSETTVLYQMSKLRSSIRRTD